MTKEILRKNALEKRRKMNADVKCDADKKICEYLLSTNEFNEADMILCYMSKEPEVGTHKFLYECIKRGKRVALPRCFKGGVMEFYEVTTGDKKEKSKDKSLKTMDFYEGDKEESLESLLASEFKLELSKFDIWEPEKNSERSIDYSDEKALCVVPGLMFDVDGYRLGWGGGFL